MPCPALPCHALPTALAPVPPTPRSAPVTSFAADPPSAPHTINIPRNRPAEPARSAILPHQHPSTARGHSRRAEYASVPPIVCLRSCASHAAPAAALRATALTAWRFPVPEPHASLSRRPCPSTRRHAFPLAPIAHRAAFKKPKEPWPVPGPRLGIATRMRNRRAPFSPVPCPSRPRCLVRCALSPLLRTGCRRSTDLTAPSAPMWPAACR
ncbi:hypothetical protein B0J12DRAFT_699816 [Macrophomina phaseolina]|uniref:Uncharacterized protein n=1 Tax=Macrophomina phaseolina TaxID=35725 RepID=A0ABQ8G9B3_9PEZI|nr:hypothetical protein B0J12DRAFT_699816 [Macrophomina phaseolina]